MLNESFASRLFDGSHRSGSSGTRSLEVAILQEKLEERFSRLELAPVASRAASVSVLLLTTVALYGLTILKRR
ncbi:MAG TPA: hypothetical protein VEK15_18720 [Vicinamibacteria bacterium]|nr:hypothetical protein [Vicinamibacteria bacterium]